MADVVFLVIVVAFFALCVGYVRVCDRIIGPDTNLVDPTEDAGAPDLGDPETVGGVSHPGERDVTVRR